MDPYTATVNLIERALEFGMKVYDDTPKEIRVQNIKQWNDFWLGVATFISTGKLPGQP